MIEDLRRLGDGSDLEADLCVVGAGAAGISIAQALVGSRVRVLLVESGGFDDEPDTQALYRGENVGHPVTLDEGRYRVFGGSTSRWTGRCAKLDAIDFEQRSWVQHSGWPIALSELEPWYERARPLCGFSASWIPDDDARRDVRAGRPALDGNKVEPFTWRYAPQGNRIYINWGRRHREALGAADNVRVLLGANVTRFEVESNGGKVNAVEVCSLTGVTRRVRARAFILCCGGIENARLLLASEATIPGGIGSGRKAIGRYMMQHPRGRVATVNTLAATAEALQDTLNIFATFGGIQYEFGLALPASVQRSEGLLNASAILTYEADPTSAWEAGKAAASRFRQGRPGKGALELTRALRDPVAIAHNSWRRTMGKRHALLKTKSVGVLIDLEQAPDPESRVTLSDRCDPFGMPQARVDWRISSEERSTAARFTELIKEEFCRLRLGEVEPEPWLAQDGPVKADHLAGTYHHIATTRMSKTPEDGVVDSNARVHGMSNLYVAGCSVFSTGGHANPTFTIVALALRLAEHLRTALAT